MRKEVKGYEENQTSGSNRKAKHSESFVWEPNFHFSPEMNFEVLNHSELRDNSQEPEVLETELQLAIQVFTRVVMKAFLGVLQ